MTENLPHNIQKSYSETEKQEASTCVKTSVDKLPAIQTLPHHVQSVAKKHKCPKQIVTRSDKRETKCPLGHSELLISTESAIKELSYDIYKFQNWA